MKLRYFTLAIAIAAVAISMTTPAFRHETRSEQTGTALSLLGAIFTIHLAVFITGKLLKRSRAKAAAATSHTAPYAVRTRVPR